MVRKAISNIVFKKTELVLWKVKIDKTLARLTKKKKISEYDKIYERGNISLRSVEDSHL